MQSMVLKHAAQCLIPTNVQKYSLLPDPMELSASAAKLLNVKRSTLMYVLQYLSAMHWFSYANQLLRRISPSAGLAARRKRVCLVCTKDPDRPVMLEEGEEWYVHVKTQKHCKLAKGEKHQEMIRANREEARLRREAKNKAATSTE
jgi:hypothetical protein